VGRSRNEWRPSFGDGALDDEEILLDKGKARFLPDIH